MKLDFWPKSYPSSVLPISVNSFITQFLKLEIWKSPLTSLFFFISLLITKSSQKWISNFSAACCDRCPLSPPSLSNHHQPLDSDNRLNLSSYLHSCPPTISLHIFAKMTFLYKCSHVTPLLKNPQCRSGPGNDRVSSSYWTDSPAGNNLKLLTKYLKQLFKVTGWPKLGINHKLFGPWKRASQWTRIMFKWLFPGGQSAWHWTAGIWTERKL